MRVTEGCLVLVLNDFGTEIKRKTDIQSFSAPFDSRHESVSSSNTKIDHEGLYR